MNRSAFCLYTAAVMGLLGCLAGPSRAAALSNSAAAGVPASDPLLFPKDNFTVATVTVKTATGEKKVVYRSYKHLLYVTKPVDKDYESLDVKVPVSIDGKTIDASHAPILFAINVGGYMSSNNARGNQGIPPGYPPGAALPVGPGGPGAGPPGPPPGGGPGDNQNLALAAGYVIVSPGARGRDNKAPDGTYYGKAPAAIVDLKAAVRYIRHNAGVLPGNDDWIVSSGCSAGGALSAILGASGNSPLYEPYLKQIGAAEEKDNIFAASCGSPVIDLDHADLSYEWAFGASKMRSGTIDQAVSAQLKQRFTTYESSLHLQGKDGFGTITANNLGDYLVKEYLAPAAARFLLSLPETRRQEYLQHNPWLSWDGKTARFTYAEFAAQHITRMKSAPAFDDFAMKSPETNEFGDKTTDSRHFTNLTLQHVTGNPDATIGPDFQTIVNMMNPMFFTGQHNPGAAAHWWIRHGAIETDSAPTSAINLALSLEKMGRDVNATIYWDAGHCQDLDPEGFIAWIGKITGYTAH